MMPAPSQVVTRDNTQMNCRYYENQFPEADDVVVVQVKSITDMGAYCSLLEYGGIEGMVLLSELSRKRIRSINRLIRVGRNEVVVVLRVDKEKGYIDLSKRRVSPEDVLRTDDRFNKAKQVQSILRHTAEVCHKTTLELCQTVSWPLYKKYGHAYDAFKLALTDPEVFGSLNITKEVESELVSNIRRRLTSHPIKIRADVNVSCFSYEGIDAVKAALRAGQIGKGDEAVKITLVAPPSYVFTCTSMDSKVGIALLKDSIDVVKAAIEKSGGKFEVKKEPRVVSQHDEETLTKLLEDLGTQNEEVGGDDDDDADAAESDEEEKNEKNGNKDDDDEDEDEEDEDEEDE